MFGVGNVWLCGSVLYLNFLYSVVVWQHVIGMVYLLFGGVSACYSFGLLTIWWYGSFP